MGERRAMVWGMGRRRIFNGGIWGKKDFWDGKFISKGGVYMMGFFFQIIQIPFNF